MTVIDILRVRLNGAVDQRVLELLQKDLGLEPEGRLDDDWDEKFGMRWLRPEHDGTCWLELYRESDTEWDVEVAAEPPYPSAEELVALRAQIRAVAKKAELTAAVTFLRSTDES